MITANNRYMLETTRSPGSTEPSVGDGAYSPRLTLVRVLLVAFGLTWAGMSEAETPGEFFAAFAKGSSRTVDHGSWGALLGEYVQEGKDGVNRVSYWRFKTEAHDRLKAYLAALQKVDPRQLDRPEQFAYWANLYNAKTIDIVLDHYPVKSIKDIGLGGGLLAAVTGGPWKAKVLNVAGLELSLDDIEHGLLRPLFKDPRVHYAINCASYGCPNLGREAFTGARLEAQLDAAARAYIAHPRAILVQDGQVTASSIYSWFQADFGGSEAGVLAHVRAYAGDALKSKLNGITAIAGYGYDWRLNDVGP